MQHYAAMAAEELEAGSLVDDRYIIERKLGAGGMGAVYAGRHRVLEHRRVAIKVPSAALAGDAHFAARFHGEAEAASQIHHFNIVQVFDKGLIPDGRPYIAMELLDGESLHALLLRQGRLTPGQGWAVFSQLCQGLAAAHDAGIVHRDLKPENVFLARPNHGTARELHVKILDFGIARVLSADTLTQPGQTLGTPYYMAPEQFEGRKLGPAADIYALGVLLYHCFTGEVPFLADDLRGLMMQHLWKNPPSPLERGLSNGALAALILDCLKKEPAARPASVRDVRARLRTALQIPEHADELGWGPAGEAAPVDARGATAVASSAGPATPAAAPTPVVSPSNATVPPALQSPEDQDADVAPAPRWPSRLLVPAGLGAIGVLLLAAWLLRGPSPDPSVRSTAAAPSPAVAEPTRSPPAIVAPATGPRTVTANPVPMASDKRQKRPKADKKPGPAPDDDLSLEPLIMNDSPSR